MAAPSYGGHESFSDVFSDIVYVIFVHFKHICVITSRQPSCAASLPGNFHSSSCTRVGRVSRLKSARLCPAGLSRRRESNARVNSESTCSLDVWFKKTEFPYIFHRKSLKTILHEFECLYRRRRVTCKTDCHPRPQLAGACRTNRGWT